jgi:hypothetical protein
MTKERDVATKVVDNLISSGALDEIVVGVLETVLEDNFAELEKLSKKKYLEAHHWQDYTDCLTTGRACVKLLQYFTTSRYDTETVRLNEFSIRLEEVF